jgi:hypothetical protein
LGQIECVFAWSPPDEAELLLVNTTCGINHHVKITISRL